MSAGWTDRPVGPDRGLEIRGRLGWRLALDVYEEKNGVFFRRSFRRVFAGDLLARMLTFRNVFDPAHQAFSHPRKLSNDIASRHRRQSARADAGDPLRGGRPYST